jgi:hypothetical protein
MKNIALATATLCALACSPAAETMTARGEVVLKRHIPAGHTQVFTTGDIAVSVDTIEKYIITVKAGTCIQDVFGQKVYDAYELHEQIDVTYMQRKITHYTPRNGQFQTTAPCEVVGIEAVER